VLTQKQEDPICAIPGELLRKDIFLLKFLQKEQTQHRAQYNQEISKCKALSSNPSARKTERERERERERSEFKGTDVLKVVHS
jgi:hypothetical protein